MHDAGKGDVSLCMLSWVKKFTDDWDAKRGCSLTVEAVGAILHTLLCAKIRNDRLATERDELRARLVEIELKVEA